MKERFSEKSDVWAFGVLAWELLSDGTKPYFAITCDDEVVAHVTGGGRLERPESECSDALWELIVSCWLRLPKNRLVNLTHSHTPRLTHLFT